MQFILFTVLVTLALSLGYLLHCVSDEAEEDFKPESHAHRGMV